MRSKWSLFEKLTKAGRVWYVRFWNPESQSYDKTRSTGVMIVGKKGRRREAEKKAQEIYEELVVYKFLFSVHF